MVFRALVDPPVLDPFLGPTVAGASGPCVGRIDFLADGAPHAGHTAAAVGRKARRPGVGPLAPRRPRGGLDLSAGFPGSASGSQSLAGTRGGIEALTRQGGIWDHGFNSR